MRRPRRRVATYYNENDTKAAAWLRELIKRGLIAYGEVDERSIKDVKAKDLKTFVQCHFFAGIGVWSYALREAGWEDDRQVWTGSCPCQPFSTAGKGKGFDDERHLWPDWFNLIRECRPVAIFGEQTSSKNGVTWLDLVSSNLEGEDYTVGSVSTLACGFGSPHKRQRLYFVADTESSKRQKNRSKQGRKSNRSSNSRESRSMADPSRSGREGRVSGRKSSRRKNMHRRTGRDGSACDMADPSVSVDVGEESRADVRELQEGVREVQAEHRPADSINGFWSGADWIGCRDGKFRAVEPGTFPLAHGAPARVGRLRGYGNALVAPQAQAFIEAYLEVTE